MAKANAQQAIKQAQHLIAQGQFRSASTITEQLASAFPNNPQILLMHSTTLHRRGRYQAAIDTMTKALAMLDQSSHEYALTQVAIADALTMMGKLTQAVDILKVAYAKNPTPGIAASLIDRCLDLDDHSAAEAILDALNINNSTLDPQTHPSLACSWARAKRHHLPADEIIAALDPVANNTKQPYAILLTIGRLLEKASRYDEAFDRYQRANQSNPPQYIAKNTTRRAQGIKQSFTAQTLGATNRPSPNPKLTRPILIVGMPRSGTTLLEQILAAHPTIAAAGELQALPEIARSFKAHLSGTQAQQLQSTYLAELNQAAGNPNAQFITDKNPMNLFLIGLVHTITPDAIIIHIQRDLRDVCLSCFTSPLANDHSYKFDLTNCAHFAASAHQTLTHFQPIIKSDPRTTWIDISYEQLTQDPTKTITQLFDSLGIEPHADCFNAHQSSRSTQTISKDQVREPMHTKSIARWQNFAHIPQVQDMCQTLASARVLPG